MKAKNHKTCLFWSNSSHQKFRISLSEWIVYFYPVKKSHSEPKREDTSTAPESVPSRSWQRLPLLELCAATVLHGTKQTCSSALLLPRPCQHESDNLYWPAGFYNTVLNSVLSEDTRFSWEITHSTINKTQLEADPYTDEVPHKEGVKWTRQKPRQDSKMLGQSRRISSWCIWVDTAEVWGNLGEDGVIKSQEIQK